MDIRRSWEIKSKDGNVIGKVNKLTYSGSWMDKTSVVVDIESSEPVSFKIGDYIDYRGERFVLQYIPSVTKSAPKGVSGDAFVYKSIEFSSFSHELTRCLFLDYVKYDNKVHYSALANYSFFADDIKKFVERIQVNLDRLYKDDNKWEIVVEETFKGKKDVHVVIENNNIWQALEKIHELYGANFVIRGRKIVIGSAGVAAEKVFKYGKGNGLYEISRNVEPNQAIVTRLRVYGNSKNMPYRYYYEKGGADVQNFIPDNLVNNRLMLPGFPEVQDVYLDSENIKELGIREASVYFDGQNELEDIFPTIERMQAKDVPTSSSPDETYLDEVVEQLEIEDDGVLIEGAEPLKGYFKLKLNDLGFDINEHLLGENAKISLRTGACGGREFEITAVKGDVITCNRVKDESLQMLFPNTTYPIKKSDRFVLLNISMPDVYISAASERLKRAGEEYLKKNDYARYTYVPKIDEILIAKEYDLAKERGIKSIYETLKEGDLMLFEDKDLAVEGSVIIDSLTIKEEVNKLPQIDVVLRNEKSVGSLSYIRNKIDSISTGGNSIGSANGGLTKDQMTSISNALYLSKTRPDTADGKITFKDGILIGEFAEDISGGKIDKYGVAELKSLKLNSFLDVPELRYNRTTFRIGNEWQGRGGGIIEKVEVLNETRGIIHLKLEKGELSSVEKDDICQGIFHQKSNNSTITSDDSRGNFLFAGFSTSYFRVVSKLENTAFLYELRPKSDRWKSLHHPSEGMHFACYGNFSDKERQSSCYTTPTYQRYLTRVNDWEFGVANIAAQFGDLSNLTIHGLNMQGYSAYLNNIYMSGTIEQLEELPIFIEISTDGYNSLRYGERLKVTCKVFKGFKDVTEAIDSWDIKRSENEYDPWLSSEKVRNFKAQKNVEENILFISNGYKTESGKIENDLLESDRTTFTITAKTETQTLKYELMI